MKTSARYNIVFVLLIWLTLLLSASGGSDTSVATCGETKHHSSINMAKNENGSDEELVLTVRSYRRGIDLLRLLYEKALSLEYHFASLQLDHRIEQLSNPMNFEDFRKSVSQLESLNKSSVKVKMPELLLENPQSSVFYVMNLAMNAKGAPEQRQQILDSMACLLNYIMNMQSDLDDLYYENKLLYLRTTDLRQRCEKLFADYTAAVDYDKPLSECRASDDWDELDAYISRKAEEIGAGMDAPKAAVREAAYRKLINFAFSVNRLVDYLDFYDEVLNSGRHMYRECELILQHLTKVKTCSASTPEELRRLQYEISEAIERFDRAYETVELKGSRLKDILYGFDSDMVKDKE